MDVETGPGAAEVTHRKLPLAIGGGDRDSSVLDRNAGCRRCRATRQDGPRKILTQKHLAEAVSDTGE